VLNCGVHFGDRALVAKVVPDKCNRANEEQLMLQVWQPVKLVPPCHQVPHRSYGAVHISEAGPVHPSPRTEFACYRTVACSDLTPAGSEYTYGRTFRLACGCPLPDPAYASWRPKRVSCEHGDNAGDPMCPERPCRHRGSVAATLAQPHHPAVASAGLPRPAGARICRSWGTTVRPRSASCKARRSRSSGDPPNSFSSFWIDFISAGCVTLQPSAAQVKFGVSARARNTRSASGP